jgi:hypothetical protein
MHITCLYGLRSVRNSIQQYVTLFNTVSPTSRSHISQAMWSGPSDQKFILISPNVIVTKPRRLWRIGEGKGMIYYSFGIVVSINMFLKIVFLNNYF